MTRPAALLRADSLTKRFGGVLAIDGASIDLADGATLAIVGPNGAGKTTLLGLLGGALRADGGSIHLAGDDVTRWSAPRRARAGIGRTHQIPRPFLDMTVRENLLAARYGVCAWSRRSAAEGACDAVLERTGLASESDVRARDLPLLRRKRLEVARALALEPRVLLLDEVGAGLVDSEVTELVTLVRSLRAVVRGIVIVEHVMRVVRECCDQVVVLDFGKPVASGTAAEVLAGDVAARIYLGRSAAPSGVAPHETLACPAVQSLLGSPRGVGAPLLELRGIHAGYGQARVLHGIDLRIEAGCAVAVVGANGAGKTTLASVINGSLECSAGEVRVDGVSMPAALPHRVAQAGVAACLEGRRIFRALSVEENLVLAAGRAPARQRRERLAAAYSLFPELEERRGRAGTAMSGGQQQMLAIARALMSRPRLVVFDEISLGLAPVVLDRLYAALAQLRAAGMALLIVEQDVERALAIADEVHVMERGRIALSGPAHEVRAHARLRQLYFGS